MSCRGYQPAAPNQARCSCDQPITPVLANSSEVHKPRGYARNRRTRIGAALSGYFLLLAIATVPWSATAGPPFLTDDPEPVEYRRWEIIGFGMGTVALGESTGVAPAVEINYGALPNVQLHITAALAYNSQSVTGTQFGYGDTLVAIKYRFINPGKDNWWPQIAMYPSLSLRTGNPGRGLGSGATHGLLPIWLQKDFGAWTTYGGGGYGINPGPGNKNYWFFGWELQRQVTEHLVLGGELFHQTASTTGQPGDIGFPLGSKVSTSFNIGGAYDLTQNVHLLFSAGHGIQNPALNQFSYFIGIQLTL